MPLDAVVVMGVAGCGKSTVGRRVAERKGWTFIEGDEYHTLHNKDKMQRGVALTDEDRLPWLNAIRDAMRSQCPVVVACSSLKASYRSLLSDGLSCTFVFLDVPRTELERRLCSRSTHFFPLSLLDSQLSTLQKPTASENSVTFEPLEYSRIDQMLEAIISSLRSK